MKLQVQNIGAIQEADITIDGITIIAGENNVGKSTVGKVLYAFLHDMSSWKNLYDKICSTKIEHFLYGESTFLEDWCMKVSGAKRRRTSKVEQLQTRYANKEDLLVAIEDYQVAEDEENREEARRLLEEALLTYCYEYISLYAKSNTDDLWDMGKKEISTWVEMAIKEAGLLKLDEIEIQIQRIKQSFQEVFNNQYRKIGTNESQIRFTDDDDRTVIFTLGDDKETLNQPVRVENRVFFVESPKIYDYLSDTRYGRIQKEYLRYLMSPNIFTTRKQIFNIFAESYAMEQEIANGALYDISSQLVSVMGGRAEFLQKVGLEFKDNDIAEPIHSVNVSTGLKSMALLEYALRIGAIEEGDILILDEPEINLHPEWQVEYAKALVRLQKEYQLKIVITTHSPYFMRAIECFTDIYETMSKLNVYRVCKDRDSDETQITNVSYSEFGMTDLYDELSAPLEELEELLDNKYGD